MNPTSAGRTAGVAVATRTKPWLWKDRKRSRAASAFMPALPPVCLPVRLLVPALVAWATTAALIQSPTTLVLDTQGRVAARFIGAVQSESILRSVVTDLVAEDS